MLLEKDSCWKGDKTPWSCVCLDRLAAVPLSTLHHLPLHQCLLSFVLAHSLGANIRTNMAGTETRTNTNIHTNTTADSHWHRNRMSWLIVAAVAIQEDREQSSRNRCPKWLTNGDSLSAPLPSHILISHLFARLHLPAHSQSINLPVLFTVFCRVSVQVQILNTESAVLLQPRRMVNRSWERKALPTGREQNNKQQIIDLHENAHRKQISLVTKGIMMDKERGK